MKKVMIIGCPGSGKTTLARKLGEKLNLPVHHLDLYYWKENKIEASQEEFVAAQRKLMEAPEWIIEGNFTKSMAERMEKADTIIFLDFPMWLSLWRFLKRKVEFYGKVRPEMGGNNKEGLNLRFLKFIIKYPRDKAIENIKKFRDGRRVIVLRNPKEAETFLNS